MASQNCLREKCKNKVDSSKRGEVFCHTHRNGVSDSTGAAKSGFLSNVRPVKIEKETVEHNDPEYGGVEDTALEGVVIETPEQLKNAADQQAEINKRVKEMAQELAVLQKSLELYEPIKTRHDELKTALRDIVDPGVHNVGGVVFDVTEKHVFDAKLAVAATATTDEEGNKVKPLLTKAQLEKISVQTPNASKANAEFKNHPEILAKLKKKQRSISIKSVNQEN